MILGCKEYRDWKIRGPGKKSIPFLLKKGDQYLKSSNLCFSVFFVYAIITHKLLDRFASNFDWVTRKKKMNVLKICLLSFIIKVQFLDKAGFLS